MAGASIAIICSFFLDSVLKGWNLRKKIRYRILWPALAASVMLIAISCIVYFKGSVLVNCLWLLICLLSFSFIAYKYIIKK